MTKINDLQKSELERASKVLDGMPLFDGADVTEVVEKIFELTEDLNDYATVSVAQLFHHLVRNHPVIPIDENDEWTFVYSWGDGVDDHDENEEPEDGLGACYKCNRYPELLKYVSLGGTTRYVDSAYYRDPDKRSAYERREVTLPYLPAYEKVVLTSSEATMDEIYFTLDLVQRNMVNYLIGKAVKENGRD